MKEVIVYIREKSQTYYSESYYIPIAGIGKSVDESIMDFYFELDSKYGDKYDNIDFIFVEL